MEGSAGTTAPPAKGETPPAPTTPPTQPPTTPPAPPEPPKPAPPAGESAADKRIRELNDRMKAAEQRAKDAEDKVKAAEREKLGDLERAQAEANDAKREAAEATARATRLERGTWARTAARDVGFIDPEDAVAMVDLGSLDTETKVKNAVEKLKESKPHLVGTAAGGQGQRPGFGNLGGAGGQPGGEPEVPVGADGQPDMELGLGRDILGGLLGRRR